jgi:hypothetical protein
MDPRVPLTEGIERGMYYNKGNFNIMYDRQKVVQINWIQ